MSETIRGHMWKWMKNIDFYIKIDGLENIGFREYGWIEGTGKLLGKCMTHFRIICNNFTSTIKLRDFFEWFVDRFNTKSVVSTSTVTLSAGPLAQFRVDRGDVTALNCVYASIHEEFPAVTCVFHILSGDSNEYECMKTACLKYGLIRQGLLLKNVRSKFAEANVDDVFKNIVDWFVSRTNQLAFGSNAQRACKLVVSVSCPDNVRDSHLVDDSRPTVFDRHQMTGQNLLCAVRTGMFGTDAGLTTKLIDRDDRCCLDVTGCPATMNQFGLANMFSEYTVVDVQLNSPEPGTHRVQFGSKFEALQAAESVPTALIDERYTAKTQLVWDELKVYVNKRLEGEY